MRSVFIAVLYKTPKKEIERIKNEFKSLNLVKSKLIFIDNTFDNKGYAAAVNKGIKLASKFKPNVYVVLNDDISFKNLVNKKIFEAYKYFDIWSFSFEQGKKKYYGGKLDKLRLSGGLICNKPKKNFYDVDFVSGSFMFIKKEVIDNIGYFDESYFLYYEEVDYCKRARNFGFKIGVDRSISYKHELFIVKNRSELKDYFLKKNRLKYLLKYGSFKQKLYELVRLPKTLIENKDSLSFNFLSLNFSSLINRFINFLLFLFLIRILSIENYGIYTLVWAHINIFSPIADFGTTTYGIVKLPVEAKEKYNYFYSLRLFTGIIAVVTTVLFAFILKLNIFVVMLIILTSPTIISNSLSGSYLIILSLKNKQYKSSIVSIIFNLILFIVSISVLLITHSIIYLFISIFFLYSIYAIFNYYLSKLEFPKFKLKFNFSLMSKIAKKSFIYILISLFAGLYFKLDIYLLAFLKNTEAVGIYSAGYKFFEALIFIAASYSISSLPTISKLYRSSKDIFINKLKNDFILLFSSGAFIAIIGFILAPAILSLFLHNSYTQSITVFKIVIFALPVIFGTTVLLNGLYILNKAYLVVYIFMFQVALNFILNYIYIPQYSFIASSFITLISEILVMVLALLLFIKVFNYENRN
ncbi:MAG: oligosaccharide flippase family protein [bacterium]